MLEQRLDDRSDRGAVPGRRQDGPQVARPVPRRGRRRAARSVSRGRIAHRTGPARRSQRRVLQLRRRHRWGADRIASRGRPGRRRRCRRSCVAEGLGRLDRGDRATDVEPVAPLPARTARRADPRRRQEARRHPRRRRLAHPRPRPSPDREALHGVGYRYIHTALDDRTRLVYSEILDDEQAVTAAAFWQPRRTPGSPPTASPVERVLTDNGSCYRSRLWLAALRRHRHDRRRRPGPTGPRPTARSSATTGSCSRNGPTSDPGPPTSQRTAGLRPVHPLLQSPPTPRRTRLVNTQPPPSTASPGTTSPASTASRRRTARSRHCRGSTRDSGRGASRVRPACRRAPNRRPRTRRAACRARGARR